MQACVPALRLQDLSPSSPPALAMWCWWAPLARSTPASAARGGCTSQVHVPDKV